MSINIRIGSKVLCKIGGENLTGTITNIELCDCKSKYGTPVKEVNDIRTKWIVVDLDINRWAYGDQIERVLEY